VVDACPRSFTKSLVHLLIGPYYRPASISTFVFWLCTPLSDEVIRQRLRAGLVIPAHPLAIDQERRLDERRMRALTRYYHAAGAGGLAVGVHTTQFSIRDPRHGLLRPVLECVRETIASCDAGSNRRTVAVAGICGPRDQALAEARLAHDLGYDAGLVSLAGHADRFEELIAHVRAVADVIPVLGFYLQPAVGGIPLDRRFWRAMAQIPRVVGIKVAPFNRYATLDVVRGVVDSGRQDDVALYTGNDDNIVADLVTPYKFALDNQLVTVRIVGGLLGQWACWTRRAVEIHAECRRAIERGTVPAGLLAVGARLTEANGAIFDVANAFRGSIAGVHEVLRRQGLLHNNLCLDPHETLSPGQAERIEDVCRAFPDLTDDQFVADHREEWLA